LKVKVYTEELDFNEFSADAVFISSPQKVVVAYEGKTYRHSNPLLVVVKEEQT